LKENKGFWLIRRLLRSRLKEDLSGPLSTLRDIAGRVGKVAEECKMEIDVDEYVSKFRPDIMEVVFAWCKGAKFAEVGPRRRALFSRSLDYAYPVRSRFSSAQLGLCCAVSGDASIGWPPFWVGAPFCFEAYSSQHGLLDSLFAFLCLRKLVSDY
jgi:hypothetical protein